MADILYEDEAVFVVRKPAGTESQRGKSFAMDLESELKNLLASRHPGKVPYLGVVHRLDRPVTGVMVYAKTKAAAASLSRQFSAGTAHKTYEALVVGELPQEEGQLRDWLESDSRSNYTKVAAEEYAQRGGNAKEALLRYRVLSQDEESVFTCREGADRWSVFTCGTLTGSMMPETGKQVHAVRIELMTGRHHQIRVQLAHAGAPVLGDTRYGQPLDGVQMKGRIALCAVILAFRHPTNGKMMRFHVVHGPF